MCRANCAIVVSVVVIGVVEYEKFKVEGGKSKAKKGKLATEHGDTVGKVNGR
jgi:hypothetical protein